MIIKKLIASDGIYFSENENEPRIVLWESKNNERIEHSYVEIKGEFFVRVAKFLKRTLKKLDSCEETKGLSITLWEDKNPRLTLILRIDEYKPLSNPDEEKKHLFIIFYSSIGKIIVNELFYVTLNSYDEIKALLDVVVRAAREWEIEVK
jgi:hypothetical protein